jgi:hypothetical protein
MYPGYLAVIDTLPCIPHACYTHDRNQIVLWAALPNEAAMKIRWNEELVENDRSR